MPTTIRIQPHNRYSGAARDLSKALGVLRANPNEVRRYGIIINWGCAEEVNQHEEIINNPTAVALATNKAEAYAAFTRGGVPCPAYWTGGLAGLRAGGASAAGEDSGDTGGGPLSDRGPDTGGNGGRSVDGRGPDRADNPGNATEGEGSSTGTNSTHSGSGNLCLPVGWDGAEANEGGILCRTLTRASGGRGITLARRLSELVEAPLYTEYVKKADEYRVHIFGGEVIDIQQKRKRREIPNEQINYQIRNHASGWVYCRDGINCPDSVIAASHSALGVLGLDFGAVDVGFNRHKEEPCVYEVNTAPGLEGATLNSYAEAIIRKLPQLQGGAYRRRRRKAA